MIRVELRIEGGFAHIPGLARPLVVDARDLHPEGAATLERLCKAVSHVGSAGSPGATPMPDARRYRLTIAGDGATRQIEATDPVPHHALAALIEFVRAHGRS